MARFGCLKHRQVSAALMVKGFTDLEWAELEILGMLNGPAVLGGGPPSYKMPKAWMRFCEELVESGMWLRHHFVAG
ncbi:MAG: hypothetical protein AAF497_03840 [Planctomycetota bacterium]